MDAWATLSCRLVGALWQKIVLPQTAVLLRHSRLIFLQLKYAFHHRCLRYPLNLIAGKPEATVFIWEKYQHQWRGQDYCFFQLLKVNNVEDIHYAMGIVLQPPGNVLV